MFASVTLATVETDRTKAIPPRTTAVVDFCEVPQNFPCLARILRRWRERCQHSKINPTTWKRTSRNRWLEIIDYFCLPQVCRGICLTMKCRPHRTWRGQWSPLRPWLWADL